MSTVAFILISSNAIAGNLNVEIKKANKGDNYMVNIHNKSEADVVISIVDNADKVIFMESIHYAERFRKVYNLSSLPKGGYSIRVNTAAEQVDEPIVINGINTPHPAIGKNILVGFSELSNDKQIELVIQNKTQKAVSFLIVDEQNRVIKEERFGADHLLKKTVNLSGLQPGNYKIKVSCYENVFFKRIQVI